MLSIDRQKKLKVLQDYILDKYTKDEDIHLVFICNQNSRRSHLAQVIAQHTAFNYQLRKIYCHSGGVQVTQVHPNTVETLKIMGYELYKKTEGTNPLYELRHSAFASPVLLYSKNFEEVTKSLKKFAAVMVCSESETNCPYVSGAERKISVPYNDPKIGDDTDNPLSEYLKTARQIKEEIEFVFSNVQQSVVT